MRFGILCSVVVLAACYSGEAALPAYEPGVAIDFDLASIDVGQEKYSCFVSDLGEAQPLSKVEWQLPADEIAVHHISLFALTTKLAPGPIACAELEGPRFTIYTPGGADLQLAADMSLALPAKTTGIGVEVHATRRSSGSDTRGRVTIVPAHERPKAAKWVESGAFLVTMPPHASEVTRGSCKFDAEAHVEFLWPHMHGAGKEFHAAVVRASGVREPLLDLPRWDANHQPLYPSQVDVSAGDRFDFQCSYENTTESNISPGPYSTDEMCVFDFIAWPYEAAHCAP